LLAAQYGEHAYQQFLVTTVTIKLGNLIGQSANHAIMAITEVTHVTLPLQVTVTSTSDTDTVKVEQKK